MLGSLPLSRYHSKKLALWIKAVLEGIAPEPYLSRYRKIDQSVERGNFAFTKVAQFGHLQVEVKWGYNQLLKPVLSDLEYVQRIDMMIACISRT